MNTGHITNDIGRVIPLHKGEYSATTPYELNDCVSFQGSTYWHYKPEETIGVLPTDETVWRLMTNATDVEPYVERALQAAEDAEEARDAAQEAETGAESAKTAAQTSASNAELAAGRAESAQDAAEDARDDAESARDDAQTAKTNAEAAKTDAEAAQTAAETAQAGAEAAKTNALASATAAYNSEQSALNAKTVAETAKTAAQSAQTAAETAEDNAVAAQTAAEAAKTAAETAQDEAETAQAGAATSAQDAQESAEDAEAYAVGKRAGVDVPPTDPAYHNNAKYFAEQAETTTQAVKYVEQTLTDAQKEQARENINATAPDGFYHGMGVGNAEQLISSVGVTDKVPYNFRTAGGSADIGNRLNDKIVGGTIAWNQLVDEAHIEIPIGTYAFGSYGTNYPFINGHKYALLLDNSELVARMRVIGTDYQSVSKTESIISYAEATGSDANYMLQLNGTSTKISHIRFHDLTAMFGPTIADYIYSLEQANAGAGVAWFKKLFPKPYYAYNAGELMSVCTNEHITRGFNAWDEQWESGTINGTTGQNEASSERGRSANFIQVTPDKEYFINCANPVALRYYDAEKNYIGNLDANGAGTTSAGDSIRLIPSNCYYLRFTPDRSYGTTYNHDICINLSWSGYRNGEYEPYVEHRYPLSPVELRGIPMLDASNNLYFDGDTYEKDGTVTRRYKEIELDGTETWVIGDVSTSTKISNAYNLTIPDMVDLGYTTAVSTLVPFITNAAGYTKWSSWVTVANRDKTVVCWGKQLAFGFASGSADLNGFKSWLASQKASGNPVKVVYPIATPTTETADPFTDPQIVDDFGTEEYVDALATAETNPRDVAIPVGHETFYQANLRDKLQNLPTNAGADGLYLVKQTGNKMELIAYMPQNELPALPSDASTKTYGFKSVNGVLTWVEE